MAGLAEVIRDLVVAYRGFAHSSMGLIALILFRSWVLVMAVFMWRRAARLTQQMTAPPPVGAPAHTGMAAG